MSEFTGWESDRRPREARVVKCNYFEMPNSAWNHFTLYRWELIILSISLKIEEKVVRIGAKRVKFISSLAVDYIRNIFKNISLSFSQEKVMDFYGNVYITGTRVTNMHNFICPVLFWSARTHPLVNSSVISLLISHFATSTGLYSISLPQDRGRIFKEKKKKEMGFEYRILLFISCLV